jgi:hypothetical protein
MRGVITGQKPPVGPVHTKNPIEQMISWKVSYLRPTLDTTIQENGVWKLTSIPMQWQASLQNMKLEDEAIACPKWCGNVV